MKASFKLSFMLHPQKTRFTNYHVLNQMMPLKYSDLSRNAKNRVTNIPKSNNIGICTNQVENFRLQKMIIPKLSYSKFSVYSHSSIFVLEYKSSQMGKKKSVISYKESSFKALKLL